eukprot:EG_transcript_23291
MRIPQCQMMCNSWCVLVFIIMLWIFVKVDVRRQHLLFAVKPSQATRHGPVVAQTKASDVRHSKPVVVQRMPTFSPTLRNDASPLHRTEYAFPSAFLLLPIIAGILWTSKKASHHRAAHSTFTCMSAMPHVGRHWRAAAVLEVPDDGSALQSDAEEEEEEEEEEWDPSLPEGFREVDLPDDEVPSQEELDALAASLGIEVDDTEDTGGDGDDGSAIPLEAVEEVEFMPLPFTDAKPSRYTEEGYAVVTDKDDHGMEVVYTMESSGVVGPIGDFGEVGGDD